MSCIQKILEVKGDKEYLIFSDGTGEDDES